MAAIQSDFWRGKRVFLTGHTGFKGCWLSLWLSGMGAKVHGFALQPPSSPNLFEQARLAEVIESTIGDIRDLKSVRTCMDLFKPDIVIHMAAQALVRLSYAEPVETYATNVMGTVNLLESARMAGTVRVVVNITTDKCYENQEWPWGYRENEPMGGYDPYSSSKGCSELVTSAYRRSFFNSAGIGLASARAGNVIGGGDWAQDRLVPDIIRAFERQEPVVIRNPHATRPWQHVLEPLSGYLVLAERLWLDSTNVAEGWNFGPRDEDAKSVQWIVERMVDLWGEGALWRLDGAHHPHEANYLKLDISKAGQRLGWQPQWNLPYALTRITQWHKAWLDKQDVQKVCLDQINNYMQSMNKEFLL